jgi:6-phosphogluconolactonase
MQMRKIKNQRELVILPDPEAVAQAGARRILALSTTTLGTQDRFSMVLSGGSTPRRLYEALATSPCCE